MVAVVTLVPWRPLRLVHGRPDGQEREVMRDRYFREWALRPDDDWWGIACGAAYDAMVEIDHKIAEGWT